MKTPLHRIYSIIFMHKFHNATDKMLETNPSNDLKLAWTMKQHGEPWATCPRCKVAFSTQVQPSTRAAKSRQVKDTPQIHRVANSVLGCSKM